MHKMAGAACHLIVSYQSEPVPVRERGVHTPLSRTGDFPATCRKQNLNRKDLAAALPNLPYPTLFVLPSSFLKWPLLLLHLLHLHLPVVSILLQ
jgi:UDP:flavonoid glycosyltransferase YjiC (YdhE family)